MMGEDTPMGGPFLAADKSNEAEVITGCDPGVRRLVGWLCGHGFHTSDSGDGKTKLEQGFAEDDGVCPFAHVAICVEPADLVSEADRLARLLWDEHEIEVEATPPEGDPPHVDASYCPATKTAMIVLLHVDDSMLRQKVEAADARS